MQHPEHILFTRRKVDVVTFDGTVETVVVNVLPMRDLRDLLACISDPAARIAMYTGRSSQWADGLVGESVSTLLEVGDGLNFPRLQATISVAGHMEKLFPATPGEHGQSFAQKSPVSAD